MQVQVQAQGIGGGTDAGDVSVVVADDHAFYRDGLVESLENARLRVLDDVPNGEAALRSVARHRPDVLVLDLSMPGLSGVDVARRLTDASPDTGIVILTVSQEEEDVLNVLLAGARGYALKDGPVDDLVSAVTAVARGEAFLSDRVAQRLGRRRGEELQRRLPPGHRLTEEETRVLDLVSRQLTLAQVAAAMDCDRARVDCMVRAVVEKLQAQGRGDIAVSSLRDRIV